MYFATCILFSVDNKWPSPVGWFSPVRRGYRMKCCKCGLVHLVDFRINRMYYNRDIIQIRVKPGKERKEKNGKPKD